jgi:hypothetical protein
MARIIKPPTGEKLRPKFVAMTPYQVYLQQVKGCIDQIRYDAQDMDYIPPQLGGLSGQRQVISEAVVLQIIEFEVK